MEPGISLVGSIHAYLLLSSWKTSWDQNWQKWSGPQYSGQSAATPVFQESDLVRSAASLVGAGSGRKSRHLGR